MLSVTANVTTTLHLAVTPESKIRKEIPLINICVRCGQKRIIRRFIKKKNLSGFYIYKYIIIQTLVKYELKNVIKMVSRVT